MRIISLIVLAIDLNLMLCYVYIVVHVAPTFGEIFSEFRLQLPSTTRFLAFGPMPAYLTIVGAALIVKEIVLTNKTTALIVNVLAGLCLALCIVMLIQVLYLPIQTLAETG